MEEFRVSPAGKEGDTEYETVPDGRLALGTMVTVDMAEPTEAETVEAEGVKVPTGKMVTVFERISGSKLAAKAAHRSASGVFES